jgi:hypothetical protein
VVVSALALAAGLLTLALLATPTQARAETITSHDRTTFNNGFSTCTADEVVFIDLSMHTVAHTTIDENGVRHTNFNFNIQGRGESNTGAKYVYHGVSNQHETFTGVVGDNYNRTFIESAQLIRQGSATPTDDLPFRHWVHVTLNDHGEVTAFFEKVEGECT